MRVLVAIINGLGFIGYLKLLSYRGAGSGDGVGSGGDSFAAFGMSFPLVYFFICFCTAFVRKRSRVVTAIGYAAHALLAFIIITIGIKVSIEGAAPFGIVGLLFSACWFAMYYGLNVERAALL